MNENTLNEIRELRRQLADAHSDSARLDFLESLMRPASGYVEVYLAGLRSGHADATAYQVEFQPTLGGVFQAPTLRDAIDKPRLAGAR